MVNNKQLLEAIDFSKSIVSVVNTLKKEYNAKQADTSHIVNPRAMSIYKTEVLDEMVRQHHQSVLTDTKALMDKNLADIRRHKMVAISAINSIHYPMRSSDDTNERIIGEQQVNNALLYLSFKPDRQAILKTVEEAYRIGRRDYASAIVDHFLSMTVPEMTGHDSQVSLVNELKAVADRYNPETFKVSVSGESLTDKNLAQVVETMNARSVLEHAEQQSLLFIRALEKGMHQFWYKEELPTVPPDVYKKYHKEFALSQQINGLF